MSFGNQFSPTWADITDEKLPDELLAPMDRFDTTIPSIPLAPEATQWLGQGIVYLPKFLPSDLIAAYCAVRSKLKSPGGWRSPTPYIHVKELRDICLYRPLMQILKALIGEDCGLHLNLTGWVSTERDFHQDSFLNPSFVGTHYAAVWMALDDIHPDSGPFQYVPGSHRWPIIRRDKVFRYLTEQERLDEGWPTHTQKWIADACMDEIVKRNAPVYTYTPKKGDVLIWHSNLIHRGSPANRPGMERKALIAHYSALSRRPDMPDVRRHDNGEHYFYFPRELE